MDLLVKHFDALVSLLFGGALAIAAVQVFAKDRSILGTVLWLSFGSAFTALGLLDLMGLIAPEWVGICRNVVVGIGCISTSISALYSPPSPSFPEWTKWGMLVFGVGFILSAIVHGLRYYWR